MGHAIGAVSKAYLNMPTEEMRKLYMSAEEFLKIERSSQEEMDETAKAKDVVGIITLRRARSLRVFSFLFLFCQTLFPLLSSLYIWRKLRKNQGF